MSISQGVRPFTWCAVIAGGCAVAATLADEDHDLAFILTTTLLGTVCAFPAVLASKDGAVRVDHPSAIMGLVLGSYWFFGTLFARRQEHLFCLGGNEYITRAGLAGVLAAVSFYLVAGLPKNDPSPRATLSRTASTFWWVLFAILWARRAYEASTGNYFTHASTGFENSTVAASTVSLATHAFRVAPSLLAVALWKRSRSIAILLVATDAGYILFSGSRLFLLHIAVILAIAASVAGGRAKIVWLGGAAAAVLLVLSPLVHSMRSAVAASHNEAPTPIEVVQSLATLGLSERDESSDLKEITFRGSASSYLADTMCFMDHLHAQPLGGETYSASAWLLIPKVAWPEKRRLLAADSVGIMNERLALPQNDRVASPVSEAYVNFSYPGVAIVFAILGGLARLFWTYRVRHSTDLGSLGLYVMVITAFVEFETHSTIATIVGGIRMPVLLMLVTAAYQFATRLGESGRGPSTEAASLPLSQQS